MTFTSLGYLGVRWPSDTQPSLLGKPRLLWNGLQPLGDTRGYTVFRFFCVKPLWCRVQVDVEFDPARSRFRRRHFSLGPICPLRARVCLHPSTPFLDPFEAVDSHEGHLNVPLKRRPFLWIVVRLHIASTRERIEEDSRACATIHANCFSDTRRLI